MGRDSTPETAGESRDETAEDRARGPHRERDSDRWTRRTFVAGTTGAGITLLAGCGGNGGSADPTGTGGATDEQPGDPAGYGEGGYGNGGFGV